MNVRVEQGAIQSAQADTVIVNLFEGVRKPSGATGAVDQALDGWITELAEAGDVTGKLGEVTVLYPREAHPIKRVLIAGLGKRDDFESEQIRKAAAHAAVKARKLGARRLASIVHGAGVGGLSARDAAKATVEGTILSLYRYGPDRNNSDLHDPDEFIVIEFDEDKLTELRVGVQAGEAVAEGTSLARDLVNMPPNTATPSYLAAVAQELAEDHHLKLTVGDRSWAESLSMGAYLAVAKGAGEEPKFIVLEHNPDASEKAPIVIVGKGITFDTGGISLKSSSGMPAMKSDMAGAAAVLGTIKASAKLGLKNRLIAIAPCTENMPDAKAYRPSDVITAMNGKTIEVVSTDAEGRLILADALEYAARFKPRLVIDLATLTGSCVVALGEGMAAGLFANDEGLRDDLVAAGTAARERLWPLPLWPDYRKTIKSEVADMKNSGGRSGGVATSAVFLEAFTSYPWAHLDIAGMALAKKATPYTPKGGTGFGVRLLSHYLASLES